MDISVSWSQFVWTNVQKIHAPIPLRFHVRISVKRFFYNALSWLSKEKKEKRMITIKNQKKEELNSSNETIYQNCVVWNYLSLLLSLGSGKDKAWENFENWCALYFKVYESSSARPYLKTFSGYINLKLTLCYLTELSPRIYCKSEVPWIPLFFVKFPKFLLLKIVNREVAQCKVQKQSPRSVL